MAIENQYLHLKKRQKRKILTLKIFSKIREEKIEKIGQEIQNLKAKWKLQDFKMKKKWIIQLIYLKKMHKIKKTCIHLQKQDITLILMIMYNFLMEVNTKEPY